MIQYVMLAKIGSICPRTQYIMLARIGSISMARTSYMNTLQRDTASQTNTWAYFMHSASQTNTWAYFMHSANA